MELGYLWIVSYPVKHPWEVVTVSKHFACEKDAQDFVDQYRSICVGRGECGPMDWVGNARFTPKAVRLLAIAHEGEWYPVGPSVTL